MIWVKCILAGAVALLISTVVVVVIQIWLIMRAIEVPPGRLVAIDVVSLAKAPRVWVVALVGFGLGFLWRFRRAMKS